MDVRSLFEHLKRDPKSYPLFERICEVLTFAPSSQHADEDELVSLAYDAFDYLQASGHWNTSSTTGRTELFWDGEKLTVHEVDDSTFQYRHQFSIDESKHPN